MKILAPFSLLRSLSLSLTHFSILYRHILFTFFFSLWMSSHIKIIVGSIDVLIKLKCVNDDNEPKTCVDEYCRVMCACVCLIVSLHRHRIDPRSYGLGGSRTYIVFSSNIVIICNTHWTTLRLFSSVEICLIHRYWNLDQCTQVHTPRTEVDLKIFRNKMGKFHHSLFFVRIHNNHHQFAPNRNAAQL